MRCASDAVGERERVEEIRRPLADRDRIAPSEADPAVAVGAIDEGARCAVGGHWDVTSSLERVDHVVVRNERIFMHWRHFRKRVQRLDKLNVFDAEQEEVGVGMIGRVVKLVEDGVVVAHRRDLDDVGVVFATIPHMAS